MVLSRESRPPAAAAAAAGAEVADAVALELAGVDVGPVEDAEVGLADWEDEVVLEVLVVGLEIVDGADVPNSLASDATTEMYEFRGLFEAACA